MVRAVWPNQAHDFHTYLAQDVDRRPDPPTTALICPLERFLAPFNLKPTFNVTTRNTACCAPQQTPPAALSLTTAAGPCSPHLTPPHKPRIINAQVTSTRRPAFYSRLFFRGENCQPQRLIGIPRNAAHARLIPPRTGETTMTKPSIMPIGITEQSTKDGAIFKLTRPGDRQHPQNQLTGDGME